jgi:hypothetical protein
VSRAVYESNSREERLARAREAVAKLLERFPPKS